MNFKTVVLFLSLALAAIITACGSANLTNGGKDGEKQNPVTAPEQTPPTPSPEDEQEEEMDNPNASPEDEQEEEMDNPNASPDGEKED
jgi:hypothetical protein